MTRSIPVLALIGAALALSACESSVRPVVTQDSVDACAGCHGDPARGGDRLVRAAPPATATAGGSAGAHLAHVTGGSFRAPLGCAECHVVPTLVDHSDHVVDVAMAGLAAADGASPSWDSGAATCSGVYCHGATLGGGPAAAPAWSSTTDLGCASCHGLPPPAPHPSGTGCGICHSGYTSSAVNLATHLDGLVQIGRHAPGYAEPGQHGPDANAAGLAACQGCHGPALDGGTSGVSCDACHASAGFADWETTCTFCHGDVASGRASPPVDAAGLSLTTNVSVGAHDAHVAATIAAPLACTTCHPDRGGSNVLTDPAHVDGDGRAEVTFGARAGAGATYTRASDTSATCSSTYCHGAPAVEWTDATPLGCASCHGVPPSGHDPAATSCTSCHPGYTASTVDPATHLDGLVQAAGHDAGYLDPRRHGYDVNDLGLQSCKACHGTDLAGGSSGISCNDCHGGTAWQTSCTFCHGDVAAGRASPPVDTHGLALTTNVTVGAHDAHVGTLLTAPLACAECHPDRTGSNVLTDTAHLDGDGLAEVRLGARAGATAVFTRVSDTSATCASTYCHGAPAVEWTDPTPLGCASCHGAPPAAPHSTSTSCGGCHPSYTASTVNAATHMDGDADWTSPHSPGPPAYLAPSRHGYEVNRIGLATCKDCHGADLAFCDACHGGTAWRTNCTFCHGNPATLLASPPVDTQGRSDPTVVSVGVHESHASAGFASPIACAQCHPDRAGSDVTSDTAHVDGDAVAEVTFAPGSLARTGGAPASYASATCTSTYCHGQFTGGSGADPSWTSTAQVGCTSCHGNPPATGDHVKHSGGSFTCSLCHVHGGFDATHVNGVKNVRLPAPAYWDPPSRTCGGFVCHGKTHSGSLTW